MILLALGFAFTILATNVWWWLRCRALKRRLANVRTAMRLADAHFAAVTVTPVWRDPMNPRTPHKDRYDDDPN